jgi:hypothetical protein
LTVVVFEFREGGCTEADFSHLIDAHMWREEDARFDGFIHLASIKAELRE